ncbi:MAG TPA: malectin domain-containing carbohydrate-binding protein, partial [Myxococcales bacterium]
MNSQLNDPLSRQRSPDWARPLQVLALLLCAGAAGCVIGDANPLGKACDESHPCPSPLACVDLVCAVAEGDAGGRDAGPAADAAVEPPDSSTDAPDSATEPPAGLDGGGRADADAVPPDAMVSDAAVAACPSGAVSSGCVCGSTFVSSGYCCGGIPRSSDCMRVRLDCGLASGTSTFDGKVFSPMLPYLTAGTAYDSDEGITGNYPIANTDYDALYQNETWVQTSSATFTIPVVNGNYTVHLHFVDWVHTGVGQRVFHVDLQGARILTDFDI